MPRAKENTISTCHSTGHTIVLPILRTVYTVVLHYQDRRTIRHNQEPDIFHESKVESHDLVNTKRRMSTFYDILRAH